MLYENINTLKRKGEKIMNETTNVVIEDKKDEVVIEVESTEEEYSNGGAILVVAGCIALGWIGKTIFDKTIKPVGAKVLSKFKKKSDESEIAESDVEDTEDGE